jgi:5-methylcytosine-specific restriction endonuclease McrA
LTGRIRKKLIQAQLESLPEPFSGETVCPLCERPIPRDEQDLHHLVPKSHGGGRTVALHRICHRQIHALFTETELARDYASVERLKQHHELARFIRWVRTKPAVFFEKSRKSQRLKDRGR